jgi:ABC-type transport system involved in multi-copper enzyme maturation permease subunit
VAELQQRGTLALLLTTPLTDGQIVGGLFASRLAHLFLWQLTALPVLSCLPLFGGVRPAEVAMGYLAVAVTQGTVAAVALAAAVAAPSLTSALVWTYGLAIVGGCIVVPGHLFGSNRVAVPVILTVAQGLVAIHAMAYAYISLRPACRAHLEQPSTDLARPGHVPAAAANRHPPVGDDALWWKEVEARPHHGCLQMVMGVVWLPVALFAFTSAGREEVGVLSCMAAVVGTTGAWWLAALTAAPAVAGERSRRTLESLLATPLLPEAILTAKAQGTLLRVWPVGVMLGLGNLLAMALGGLHPVGFLLEALLFLAVLGFAVALGLALSVACRAPDRATLLTAAALLYVTCGGLPLTALVLGEDPDLAMGLTPPRGIALLHATTWERLQLLDRGSGAYLGACLGIPVYGVAALGLWLLAQGRFHRLARNGGG